jgi:hypothetical protein
VVEGNAPMPIQIWMQEESATPIGIRPRAHRQGSFDRRFRQLFGAEPSPVANSISPTRLMLLDAALARCRCSDIVCTRASLRTARKRSGILREMNIHADGPTPAVGRGSRRAGDG